MAETISHYFVFAGYSKDSCSVILLFTLTPLIIDVYTKPEELLIVSKIIIIIHT